MPPRMVKPMNFLNRGLSPSCSAAKPNTMVTLLTISKKVINAVRLMPSTSAGTGQLLLW